MILVTGAGGFVGKALCHYLSEQNLSVVPVFRPGHAPAGFKGRKIEADLCDPASVSRFIARFRPTGIFHLAAQSVPRFAWADTAGTFTVNTGATLNLLRALRTHSPAARLVYVSSIQVYGRRFYEKIALDEHDWCWPEDPYSASKLLSEWACRDFHRRFGLNVVVVRPSNIVGPGQRSTLAFSGWTQQILAGEKKGGPMKLKVGNLKLKRDFIHIHDALSGLLTLYRRGKSGEVYNLAAGRPEELSHYCRSACSLAHVPVSLEVDRSLFRKIDYPQNRVSARRIRSAGWKPEKNAFAALRELLETSREAA